MYTSNNSDFENGCYHGGIEVPPFDLKNSSTGNSYAQISECDTCVAIRFLHLNRGFVFRFCLFSFLEVSVCRGGLALFLMLRAAEKMLQLYRSTCPTSKQNTTKTKQDTGQCVGTRPGVPHHAVRRHKLVHVFCSTCHASFSMRSTTRAAHIVGVVLFSGASE